MHTTIHDRVLMLACVAIFLLLGLVAPLGAFAEEGVAREHAAIAAEVEAQVQQALPWPGATATLKSLRIGGDVPHDGEWHVTLVPTRRWRSTVRAELTAPSLRRPIWVTATFEILVETLVVTQTVGRDESLRGAVSPQMVDVDRLPHDAITDVREIEEGAVARTRLMPGRPLRQSMVLMPEVIARGQMVRVVVRRGSVMVTDRGIALESGRLGEPVRVQSASTERTLTGVARADGSIEVP